MRYFLIVLLAYLIGCSNMAYYLSKLKNVDFRKGGSGNLGASNAAVLLGWWAGILVGAHDISKAALAVWLAKLLFPGLEYAGAAAGVACVLGHIFPFWLKFKGGKGLASYLGMALVLNWKVAVAAMILLVIITVVTDYIVLGTMATCVVVPLGIGILDHTWIIPLILMVATLTIVYKHRENLVRIRNRTEIGLRSTAKGENRVKSK